MRTVCGSTLIACLAGTLTGFGGGAAAADTGAQDRVLQAESRYAPTQVDVVAAGTTGFLTAMPGFLLSGCSSIDAVLQWTRYDTGATTTVDHSDSSQWCGASAAGESVYVQQVLNDGSYRVREMNSGAALTFRMPTGYRNLGLAGPDIVAGVLSDDGLSYSSLHFLSWDATGITSDTPLSGLPEGAVVPTSSGSALEASDSTQAALFFHMPDQTARMGVVDLDTGAVRSTSGPVEVGRQVHMDSAHVIWVTGGTTVHTLTTSDLSAPERTVALQAVSFDTYQVGLDGDFVLAERGQQYDDSPDPLGTPLLAYPLDGGAPRQVLQYASGSFAETPDREALAVGGGSSVNWWVQHLSPGGQGAPVATPVMRVPPTPAILESLSAAGGTVTAAYDDTTPAGGAFYNWAPTLSQPLQYGTGSSPYPCGEYNACRDQQVWASGSGAVDYVDHGSTVSVRAGRQPVKLPATSAGPITGAFGRYVLRSSSYGQTPSLEVDDVSGPGLLPEHELFTRSAAPAALWGSLLYAADSVPGEITVTDVPTGRTVRTLNVGADCGIAFLQVVGHWLWRSCSDDAAADPFAVWDLDAGRLIALPPRSAGPQTMLGDGYIVSQDSQTELYLTDFHSGTAVTTDLGVRPRQETVGGGQRSPWTVDQYGGGLVYRAADDSLHVKDLGVPTAPLSVPDSAVPASFDRDHGDTAWNVTWWLSKPVASWKLTLTDASGATVASRAGGVTSGAVVNTSWAATTDVGDTSLPAGTYTWKLAAPPADGRGAPLTLTGTVRVTGASAGKHPALFARVAGSLEEYHGTGEVANAFGYRAEVGSGYQQYGLLVSVSGQGSDGTGDVVGRDSGGTLWLHRGTGKPSAPLAARTKVGTGWNQYNRIVGAGDVTGDGKGDLLARDAAGVLWLHRGTGNAAAPFAARTRIGTGWNQYNQILRAGDVDGGGRSDLFVRDAAGGLWCFLGTGVASAPFAKPVKVATGWNSYDLLM